MDATQPPHQTAPDTLIAVVKSLVLYSLAEVQSGHASTIRVSVQGRSFSVSDDGRGHALAREVDGVPYLTLIYRHFEYPFGRPQAAPVQLQGLATSLVNALCSDLVVTVRKPQGGLVSRFRDGCPAGEVVLAAEPQRTGNCIEGTIRACVQPNASGLDDLRRWLAEVAAAHAGLKLYFNDQHL